MVVSVKSLAGGLSRGNMVQQQSQSQPLLDLSHIAEALRPLAVPVGSLLSDPANARTHGPQNLDAIAGSLAVYGQQKPVVVRQETMTVVAGNGTLEAARRLGWTHIAANVVPMDAATAAGFAIADNRSSELAGWDPGALDKLLRTVNTGNDERLDAMMAELAGLQGIIPKDGEGDRVSEAQPPDDFSSYDESLATDYRCPKCSYEWSGKPK